MIPSPLGLESGYWSRLHSLLDMNNKVLNSMLAPLAGWKVEPVSGGKGFVVQDSDGGCRGVPRRTKADAWRLAEVFLPDYTRDLNACQQIVTRMSDKLRRIYCMTVVRSLNVMVTAGTDDRIARHYEFIRDHINVGLAGIEAIVLDARRREAILIFFLEKVKQDEERTKGSIMSSKSDVETVHVQKDRPVQESPCRIYMGRRSVPVHDEVTQNASHAGS